MSDQTGTDATKASASLSVLRLPRQIGFATGERLRALRRDGPTCRSGARRRWAPAAGWT